MLQGGLGVFQRKGGYSKNNNYDQTESRHLWPFLKVNVGAKSEKKNG